MALDDFDITEYLKSLFGDGGSSARPKPMKTLDNTPLPSVPRAEAPIPQVDGVPWYRSTPKMPVGPATGVPEEPENDQFTSFLSERESTPSRYLQILDQLQAAEERSGVAPDKQVYGIGGNKYRSGQQGRDMDELDAEEYLRFLENE